MRFDEEEIIQQLFTFIKLILLQKDTYQSFINLNGVSLCLDMIKAKNFMTLRAFELLSILASYKDSISYLLQNKLLGFIFPFFEYDLIEFRNRDEEETMNENLIELIFNLLINSNQQERNRVLKKVGKTEFIRSLLGEKINITKKLDKINIENDKQMNEDELLLLRINAGLLIRNKISFILYSHIKENGIKETEFLNLKVDSAKTLFCDIEKECKELKTMIDDPSFLVYLEELDSN